MEFPLCKENQMHEVTQFNITRKKLKYGETLLKKT